MENTVTLLDYYGGDMRICLSAWQSTNIDLDIELSDDIKERLYQLYDATVVTKKKTPQELLAFLASHKHTSPFRKALLDFQITADVATHIQCLKHRVGVEINAESARYKELTDKWYVPKDWRGIDVCWLSQIAPKSEWDGRDLAEDFVIGNNGETWEDILDRYAQLGHELYHVAIDQLTPILGRSRAKESARYFLPYAKQLDFDMQMSFEAFVHFVKLRNSPHAQVEIQQIAQSMLEQVKAIPGNPFQYSLEAFGL